MLKVIPDHLKTKKISKNVVKKFQFVIKYPNRFKTKQMCDKVIIKNATMLMFISK